MPGLGLSLRLGRTKKSGSLSTGEATVAALEAQAASDGYTAFSGDAKDASLVLVNDLVAAGVWDKLDLFYVFATNGDSDFATYNWIDPTTFKATTFNSPTFTSLEGFTGNGSTAYIDLNFNPQTDGTNYLLNSASGGFYSRTNEATTDLAKFCGVSNNLTVGKLSGNYYWRANAVGPNNGNAVAGNNDGFVFANRDGATSDNLYRNGVSVDSSSTESGSLDPGVRVFRRSSTYSSAQVSIAFLGGDLSSEASDFYTAVQTYMTTIGKQV